MKKIFNGLRFTSATLAIITLASSVLTGCANIGAARAESGLKKQYEGSEVNTIAITDFDKALEQFIEESGYSDENYMISPTSFRAALALAVAGADNETKDELISAMGFKDMDELNAWYYSTTEMVDDFDSKMAVLKKDFEENKEWYGDDAEAPEGSLVMLNSIWKNTDRPGKFGKEYVNYVSKYYGAEANNVSAAEINEKVNGWVNKGTHGLIKEIANNLENANAVLINTLYLKSSWTESFSKSATTVDNFTTKSGEKVEKEFMFNKESFRFYEDKKGKLVVLPMNGGIDAVFVLGEIEDVHDALSKATSEDVRVQIPKFEIESNFSKNEFLDFMVARGAQTPFDDRADFSIMCPDCPLCISDIIQKTKIKVDEDGLEAAAATAIMMVESCALEEEEPKEFIANEPFKFYILGGENDQEVLFSGQIVK